PLYFVQERASLLKVGECLLIPTQHLGYKAQVMQARAFPARSPQPIDAIQCRMEQRGLSLQDLDRSVKKQGNEVTSCHVTPLASHSTGADGPQRRLCGGV